MDTYLNHIPTELIQEVCLYLDHISIVFLYSTFKTKINFEYLLSVKFPGFYKIVKTIISNPVKYMNLTYEGSHEKMYLFEKYIQHGLSKNDKLFGKLKINDKYINIHSNNPEDIISIVYENNLKGKLIEIIKLYEILTGNNKLFKYRIHFPNIHQINRFFMVSCKRYPVEVSDINWTMYLLEGIPRYTDVYHDQSMINLCDLFLVVLHNPIVLEILK